MAADKRAARLGILALVGVILMGLIGVRLWFLQTVKAEELQARVEFSKQRVVPLLPECGRIFDSKGRILAGNKRILTVGVDWQLLRKRADREEIFRRLSGWIGVPIEEMQARYDAKIDSPFLPMPVARDVSEEVALALLERVEDFPGVSVLKEWDRVYPYAPHAAHVVGYMGAITKDQKEDYLARDYVLSERVGQFGIVLSMESVLHGQWGRRVYEVDAAERPVRLIEEVPPINGFDVQLTIDLDLQQYAEQAIETTLEMRRELPPEQQAPNPEVRKPNGDVEKMDPKLPDVVPYKAPAASALVMDYSNGQVKALASYPTFDNRWFEAGLSSEKFKQIFPDTEDPDRSILVNRAIQGRYNMGSTFKPFTAYAALSTGLISPVELFEDVGEYRMHSVNQDRCDAGLVRCVYKNATCKGTGRPCKYGPVNVTDALAISSDAFFYRIGEDIMVRNGGAPVLQEQVELFGFGADTGIDLPFEFDGTVPDAELKRRYAERGIISEDEGRNYFAGDNVQLAIGQGLLSATPLQLALGYATIANQGFVFRPQIVKAIWNPGVPEGEPGQVDLTAGTIHESFEQPDLIRQIPMPSDVWEPIVRGLERVVTPGAGVESDFYHFTTGENLFYDYPDDAIPLGGKTGTAQGAGNFPWNDSSVFTGFSRDETRPFVVTAYLEKSGYGSQAAGPVVKCMFLALSGITVLDPVVQSDPLDLNSTRAAPSMELADTSCYKARFAGTGINE
ncbi:MAG: penicillin-binding transpeptidase domain-containing protein [Ilumatobacteraceae bacterium]